MERQLLIDLHAHSSGISKCCRIDAEAVIKEAVGAGLDGIVLTNHYQRNSVGEDGIVAFIDRYMEEFRRAREIGERYGCRVLFGIEITAERYTRVHLLVYGVGENFLYDHPDIFEWDISEIYRAVKSAGGVLIQAHPHRRGDRLVDTRYLDGIEVSCHPLYEGTHLEKMLEIAGREGMILTCGGDYHADTHRPKCGMYLPPSVDSGEALGAYLKSAKSVRIAVQEVDENTPHDVNYERTNI